MVKLIAVAWVLFALPPVFGGCAQPAPHPLVDHCGDIRPATFPILNGVDHPNPEVISLLPSQIKAVGAILINYGAAICSATMIAPAVVLTAAHCIDYHGIFSVLFIGGVDIATPEFVIPAQPGGWFKHPSYGRDSLGFDIAVILLTSDGSAQGITPIPPNCEQTRLAGKIIQAVGYGKTRPEGGYNTRRWWTTLRVTMESTTYYTTYDDFTGLCGGDSGGPMLYTKDDGNVYVMGVASAADEGCVGSAFYPRTDFSCDSFISQYLPRDPCEGETPTGRCDGQSAVWCEAETVMRQDCNALGYNCAQDGSGNFRCLPPPDPCQGETFEGRCDGNTAVWCEAGIVTRLPCSEPTLCGNLGDGLFRCVDECALIGMRGRCDELGRARWCEGGTIRIRDCTACGQACGWVDDKMGNYCL